MPGPRHRARELALKVLFQLEHSPEDDRQEALAYHAADDRATPDVTRFAGELVDGVLANREELDDTIQRVSTNWRLDQMGRVDRVVLRMAVYEIAETEPGVRGDTVSGTTKPARVETGHTVNVPLFVNQGDRIRVDTRTGNYIERL